MSMLRMSLVSMIGILLGLCGCGDNGSQGEPLSSLGQAQRADLRRARALVTVTANAGAGTAVSPASQRVPFGDAATFVVTLLSGYSNLVVSGAGGLLNGSTYVTAPVRSDATISTAATRDPPLAPVICPSATDNPGFAPGYEPREMRITPNAIFTDEYASAPVRVTLRSGHASAHGYSMSLEKQPWWEPLNTIRIPLYDNGSHGDEVACDGIHTAVFTLGTLPPLEYYDNSTGSFDLYVVARDSSGSMVPASSNINHHFTVTAIDRRRAIALTKFGDLEYGTSHFVNFVIPDFDAGVALDTTSITRMLYARYPDVFDFITIPFIGSRAPGDATTIGYLSVRDSIQGIGKKPMDVSGAYGSAGVLRGVLAGGAGEIMYPYVHEIGHSTCCYFRDPRLPLAIPGGHIIMAHQFPGQMDLSWNLVERPDGDFDVVTLGAGTYKNRFSMLELYLMGLVSASSVPPERYAMDLSASDPSAIYYPIGAVVPRDKTALVTVDDIVGVYGPRIPDFERTPKEFRIAHVVVSNRPLLPAEVALEQTIATHIESRPSGADATKAPVTFWYATEGRATMTSVLPARRP